MLGEPGRWSRGAPQDRVPFCFVQSPPGDFHNGSRAVRSVSMHIDLNADLGESFGIYVLGDDAGLMATITSANIACGFHAGDPSVLRRTVRLAKANGVSIGAHPSFPDLAGFGRREMHLPHGEVEDSVLYQIASVAGVAAAEGMRLRHVKPHGALYNMAARDRGLATAIVRAISAYDRTLTLFAPPGSELAAAGCESGLTVAREGFADRTYDRAGSLVSRQMSGALLHDDPAAASQAIRLVKDRTVVAIDGAIVAMEVDTLCLHGDAPGAAARAAAIRSGLEAAGVDVRPFGAS
jgi:5-oxoprolinase (ATP-hydrolysing) subunit A